MILEISNLIDKHIRSRQKAVLIGLVFLALWESIIFPKTLGFLPVPVFTAIALVILIFGIFWIKHLNKTEIFSEKVLNYLDYLILPCFLALGTTFYIFLDPSIVIKQVVAVFSLLFLVIVLSTLNIDKRGSIVSYNIFIAGTILALWFSYWSIYYLSFYTVKSYAFLVVGILFITFLMLHQLFFSLGKDEEKKYYGLPNLTFWYYLGTFTLIILELSVALIFWPTLPYIKALVLLLSFFILWEITWHYFSGKLTKKVLFEYAGIVAIIFLVLARAVQWYPI